MKKSLIVLGLIVAALCLNSSVFAEESNSGTSSTVKESKFCPICGPAEKMEGDAKYTHEFDGETYYFCSKECLETFKADPEKYIKMMQEKNYSEGGHGNDNEESHEGHDHDKEADHKGHKHNEEGSEHEGHDHK